MNKFLKFKIDGYEILYTASMREYLYKLGYTDADIKSIGTELVDYKNSIPPQFKGDTIKGSSGAIKVRVSPKNNNKGTRGSDRLIYCFLDKNKFYFLDVYSKSVQEDLTSKEIKAIKSIITWLKDEIRRAE